MYLVLHEVIKKQKYIFKSNRVKENVGASEIIKYVTEELCSNSLDKFNGKPLLEGGGKSIYIFKEECDAKSFIACISKDILKNYPGVEFFMTYIAFDYDKENIIDVVDRIHKKLHRKRNDGMNTSLQIGFGVEEKCVSTGMPATTVFEIKSGERRLVSEEIKVKLQKQKDSNKGFNELVSNNKSYIAVVHIDGNKMGQKIEKLKKIYGATKLTNYTANNDEYIKALSKLSKKIKDIYEKCFENCKEFIKTSGYEFIPIILGGDDVTFVCTAEVAVGACNIFLEELSKDSNLIEIGNEKIKLTACAGITIMRETYPFSRGYTLAESLCQNGKDFIAEVFDGKEASLIDWHIVQGEIASNIESIRNNNYKVDGTILNMRPIVLDNNNLIQSYKNFKYIFNAIKCDGVPRSKVKKLRSLYLIGKNEVNTYIKRYNIYEIMSNSKQNINKVSVKGENPLENTGYYTGEDQRALYFDAIESIDLIDEKTL